MSSSDEPFLPRGTLDSYESWRDDFARQRLRILYVVGLICNPAFALVDFLVHPETVDTLVLMRVAMEVGLLLGLLGLRKQIIPLKPNVLLGFFVLWPSLLVAHMTVITGGFSSQYYAGLSLVFLGAAVIVPVYWRSHLFAQLITLLYYYAGNFLIENTPHYINVLVQNSFFILWTCTALIISVFLYERLQRAEFEARVAERQAHRELEATNRKLLELDRLKNEFFANISHELRTPLTLILGAFHTLAKSSGSEVHTVIHAGLRNSSRLLLLINELLELARFDSGRAKLNKQAINFTHLIRSVAANFDSSQNRRVHYRGLDEPVVIHADPRQLRNVLYNLLSNAFKFSDPENGQVWLRLATGKTVVKLEVEDNGIGISREYLNRIFDRFTQVESSLTRKYEGTGIGLALVKEVVTLHGGTIDVESEVGRGTTFVVSLPIGGAALGEIIQMAEDETEPFLAIQEPLIGALADETSEWKGSEDKPLILVADDNSDMRSYLAGILQRDYRVLLAKDGEEAFNKALDQRPELILTDAMMPHMSGYDLLLALKKEKALQNVPVVFVTARVGTDAYVETLESGADDYISKPFNEQELIARVRNLLRARRQERELLALQKKQLAQFLPEQVGELIVSGDTEQFLKGHRRDITVVFVDLRGFTAFAEIADPEDVMATLQEYQSTMGRVVMRHQGTIQQFAGDSIEIFLNDPTPLENHPEWAVRMAISMREEGVQLRKRWLNQGYNLGCGIGVATGYATLGIIGLEGRKDYSGIGTVVNLAARLCNAAEDGQILIPERVNVLLSGVICSENVGRLQLKGFHQPTSVYNVIGLKDHT
jgi:signal transduction histidine kinase/class 3 adenylate cyclase